uniref:ribonuclease H n=1 Tax=Monopterus albus TaxID=43700 RepID=A0A3Q3J830_MONAL
MFLEPLVRVTINGRDHLCLIDSGAMYSTLNSPLPRSQRTTSVISFSGLKEEWPFSEEVPYSLPSALWSTCPTDVGLIKVDPVRISLHEGAVPVYRAQYPLTLQQVSGIEKTIHGLLEAGVLTPTQSSWNRPINPVPKAGKPDYRMVHDLRAVNKLVVPTNHATPNPYTMLNAISSEHRFFKCINLANAFFSVPLHRDSQDMFAFMYKRTTATGVCLLQYVDDLLLAAPDSESIMTATGALLTHLHRNGFKVSKDKLQIGRPRVAFLGLLIQRPPQPAGSASPQSARFTVPIALSSSLPLLLL